VFSWMVVAFGYHVAPRANRAKFGNRDVSIRDRSSMSSCTGNASMTNTTTGAGDVARAFHRRGSPAVTRLDAFEVIRNIKAITAGASASTEQPERSTSQRA